MTTERGASVKDVKRLIHSWRALFAPQAGQQMGDASDPETGDLV